MKRTRRLMQRAAKSAGRFEAMSQPRNAGIEMRKMTFFCSFEVGVELYTIDSALHTANCIIIAPKRLKLRLSGSARKSQKRFRDTPRFKFQAVLARTQPFLSRSVEKRGDQSRFKCRKMVRYYAIFAVGG